MWPPGRHALKQHSLVIGLRWFFMPYILTVWLIITKSVNYGWCLDMTGLMPMMNRNNHGYSVSLSLL